MGPNKFVHLTFAVAGLLGAFLIAKAGDWAWSYFAKPNDLVMNGIAILVAAAAALAAYRSEQTFTAVVEVTRELEKVTWPTRKETSAATVVVIVTVTIAALILTLFDYIWSAVTKWFLS